MIEAVAGRPPTRHLFPEGIPPNAAGLGWRQAEKRPLDVPQVSEPSIPPAAQPAKPTNAGIVYTRIISSIFAKEQLVEGDPLFVFKRPGKLSSVADLEGANEALGKVKITADNSADMLAQLPLAFDGIVASTPSDFNQTMPDYMYDMDTTKELLVTVGGVARLVTNLYGDPNAGEFVYLGFVFNVVESTLQMVPLSHEHMIGKVKHPGIPIMDNLKAAIRVGRVIDTKASPSEITEHVAKRHKGPPGHPRLAMPPHALSVALSGRLLLEEEVKSLRGLGGGISSGGPNQTPEEAAAIKMQARLRQERARRKAQAKREAQAKAAAEEQARLQQQQQQLQQQQRQAAADAAAKAAAQAQAERVAAAEKAAAARVAAKVKAAVERLAAAAAAEAKAKAEAAEESAALKRAAAEASARRVEAANEALAAQAEAERKRRAEEEAAQAAAEVEQKRAAAEAATEEGSDDDVMAVFDKQKREIASAQGKVVDLGQIAADSQVAVSEIAFDNGIPSNLDLIALDARRDEIIERLLKTSEVQEDLAKLIFATKEERSTKVSPFLDTLAELFSSKEPLGDVVDQMILPVDLKLLVDRLGNYLTSSRNLELTIEYRDYIIPQAATVEAQLQKLTPILKVPDLPDKLRSDATKLVETYSGYAAQFEEVLKRIDKVIDEIDARNATSKKNARKALITNQNPSAYAAQLAFLDKAENAELDELKEEERRAAERQLVVDPQLKWLKQIETELDAELAYDDKDADVWSAQLSYLRKIMGDEVDEVDHLSIQKLDMAANQLAWVVESESSMWRRPEESVTQREAREAEATKRREAADKILETDKKLQRLLQEKTVQDSLRRIRPPPTRQSQKSIGKLYSKRQDRVVAAMALKMMAKRK